MMAFADSSSTAAEINIRGLASSDEAQWEQLWRAYHIFYEATVADEIYPMNFRRLLPAGQDSHPKMHALVAECDGVLVGLVHFLQHPHNWKVEEVTYLQDLYVDKLSRGRGIARRLIVAVYARADELGATAVYWSTQDFNHTARKLYDRVGVLTPFIKYKRP